MSRIPNSAMPHTYARDDSRLSRREQLGEMLASARRWAGEHMSSARRAVRHDPRIAAAAGTTLIAGLAAVFAPRLWRQRAAIGL